MEGDTGAEVGRGVVNRQVPRAVEAEGEGVAGAGQPTQTDIEGGGRGRNHDVAPSGQLGRARQPDGGRRRQPGQHHRTSQDRCAGRARAGGPRHRPRATPAVAGRSQGLHRPAHQDVPAAGPEPLGQPVDRPLPAAVGVEHTAARTQLELGQGGIGRQQVEVGGVGGQPDQAPHQVPDLRTVGDPGDPGFGRQPRYVGRVEPRQRPQQAAHRRLVGRAQQAGGGQGAGAAGQQTEPPVEPGQ